MSADQLNFEKIKFFSTYHQGTDKHPTFGHVFKASDASYLHCELEIENRFLDEPLNANIDIILTLLEDDNLESDDGDIIHIEHAAQYIHPSSYPTIFVHNLGIDKDQPLENGKYRVTIRVDNIEINSPVFFITDEENLTDNFCVEDIRLMKKEMDEHFIPVRKQLTSFCESSIYTIRIEFHLKNKIYWYGWPCEISFHCTNKEATINFTTAVCHFIKEGTETQIFSFSPDCNWPQGIYTSTFQCDNQIVASFEFEIGSKDIEGCSEFTTDMKAKPKRDNKIKFSRILDQPEFTPFPLSINDESAIQLAYSDELTRITDYVKNGLSVLVICDKVLIEFVFAEICRRSGKKPIHDNVTSDNIREISSLFKKVTEGDILIFRNFDVLGDIVLGGSILFQPNDSGSLPQLLAFSDSVTPIKEGFKNRFALSERIQGLPREVTINNKQQNPLSYLITKEEKSIFKEFNEVDLFKNIVGLNVLQLRNALKYLKSTLKEPTENHKIYQTLRKFKQNSKNVDIDLPDTTFDDIGGYEEVKKYILTSLSLFQKEVSHLSVEEQQDAVPKGFIFYGPPGTGKTMFAKAIANHLNATIQMISGPEIVEMWVGKSEENIRKIFANARKNAPAVLLFDEFDSIAVRRSNNTGSGSAMVANSIMAQLLTELDGFLPTEGIMVIGTTNRIDIIDQALMRPSRLKPVLIDLPDYEARRTVAKVHAKHYKIDQIVNNIIGMTMDHYDTWMDSSNHTDKQSIPGSLIDAITEKYPSFKKRLSTEANDLFFRKDFTDILKFIKELEQSNSVDDISKSLLSSISNRFDKLNIKMKTEMETDKVISSKSVLEKEIEDIYAIIQGEITSSKDFIKENYFGALINLIAEFTERFNNDEIGSLFKEAAIAHNIEGRLLSPKYFGEKIGMIKSSKESKGPSAIMIF